MNLDKHKVLKNNLGIVDRGKFDPINWLITLSMIPLSGAQCNIQIIDQHTKIFFTKLPKYFFHLFSRTLIC
jgi:hypothetical protein